MFIRKALESLAGRESGEPQRVKEHARREMGALRDAFNKRIADLEQVGLNELLRAAHFSFNPKVVRGLLSHFFLHSSVWKRLRKRLTRWQPSLSRRSWRILTWKSSSKPWVPSAPSPPGLAKHKTCSRLCRKKTGRNTIEKQTHEYVLIVVMFYPSKCFPFSFQCHWAAQDYFKEPGSCDPSEEKYRPRDGSTVSGQFQTSFWSHSRERSGTWGMPFICC